MLVFEYILILLAAIFLSNIINRFIPFVSVPIIQIALGALVTLIPIDYQPELDPNLFFVLFVAPLIFNASMLADKKSLWTQRRPILNMGILLVFATVIITGYCVHLFIPSIPLAVAFVLIGALGPTDDVAVISISNRVNVPPKMMRILLGESIINDASGIVCFQFALAAVLTGTFSIVDATGRFFVVALGGIAVGLLFSWLKYEFLKWIRSLGMENVTLHILIAVLTPFAVYLIAENWRVSGILAVFAAGIAHSFKREKFNPAAVNLNIASDSIWSVLSFTLEGLVFLILGTQLPKILATVTRNTYPIGIGAIVGYIFLITFIFIVLRMVWSMAFIRPQLYTDPENPVSRRQACLIFGLSGARGAVTLASVLSIPLLLSDGNAFPHRDLVILLSSGVILVSLAITNFVLPLFVDKKTAFINPKSENEACIEILNHVIDELKGRVTPENIAPTSIVIKNYYTRLMELQRKHNNRSGHADHESERRLQEMIYRWEKENTANLLARNETDEDVAVKYFEIIDVHLRKFSRNKFYSLRIVIRSIIRFIHRNCRKNGERGSADFRARLIALIDANSSLVLENLREMAQTNDSDVLRKTITNFEFIRSIRQSRGGGMDGALRRESDTESIVEAAAIGFQIERDKIQAMVESGRIPRETAKEMRHNLSLLELQMKQETFFP